MSRREYPVADRYDDTQSEFYRRPRRDRDYDDFEVDITRERYPEERRRRPETVVKEREQVERERRGPRQPDFLREDYGKSSTAGQLVVREERDEEDSHSRVPSRVSRRSRAPPERVEEEIVFKERDRSDRGPPYPGGRSEVEFREKDREDIVYRERPRSRAPPPPERASDEEIDFKIRREERENRPPPPRSEAPVEEIRFRRGGGDRPRPPPEAVEKTEIDIRERERSAAPPPARRFEREEIDIRERSSARPPRSEVDREEIVFRERRSPPGRGREDFVEEIDIRERNVHRHRSRSRPNLVARKEEEWIVRRPRTPSPPPPRDYEKEEIIIRRNKERTPSPEPVPEPPREPTPEPPPPPPVEPIYRPPIIQEVITHHRHIDHGVERARSPTPPPPPAPAPPSPPKEETREDNLEIEIRRKGIRNGKPYEEDITFEQDIRERDRDDRVVERRRSVSIDRKRSASVSTRRRSHSRDRYRYDDDLAEEAEYYNRKIASRAYPGEAYNGATRDWALVDVPPGTERVRMDGVGGGAQEITWQRYNGERRGKFISGDQVYEAPYGNGHSSPPPLAAPPRGRDTYKDETEIRERSSHPPRDRGDTREETKITYEHRSGGGGGDRHRKRDKMWTEVTKDLVVKEAIDEMGYEYEETDDHFYVMEYLKYVSGLNLERTHTLLTFSTGRRPSPG